MSFAFRPGARIEIDGQSLDSAEAGLESASVTLAIGAHGQAALTLWPSSKFASTTPGSALSIALGEDKTLVLTGAVAAVAKRPDRLLIEALDATAAFSRTRRSTTFRDLDAADIVKALAAEAGVATATIDGGSTFAAYSIDNRSTLWRHLRALAALTGADLVATADGELRFAAGSGAQVRQLRKGVDLLHWRTETGPALSPPGFGPHGAASTAGPRNWHHLEPDPLGEAPPPAHVPGAARSREVADLAATAAARRAARVATRAYALMPGNAAVRPADTLEIVEQESGALLEQVAGAFGSGAGGSQFRVVTVRHRFDGLSGFTTALALEGAAADVSPAGVLGGGVGG
jgi:hypothetical protein